MMFKNMRNSFSQMPVSEDWQFGGGAKYRPGQDPMKDQRLWAPLSFNQMVGGARPPQQTAPVSGGLTGMIGGDPNSGWINPKTLKPSMDWQSPPNNYQTGKRPPQMSPRMGEMPRPLMGNETVPGKRPMSPYDPMVSWQQANNPTRNPNIMGPAVQVPNPQWNGDYGDGIGAPQFPPGFLEQLMRRRRNPGTPGWGMY